MSHSFFIYNMRKAAAASLNAGRTKRSSKAPDMVPDTLGIVILMSYEVIANNHTPRPKSPQPPPLWTCVVLRAVTKHLTSNEHLLGARHCTRCWNGKWETQSLPLKS